MPSASASCMTCCNRWLSAETYSAGPLRSFRELWSSSNPTSVLPLPTLSLITLSRLSRALNQRLITSVWMSRGNANFGARLSVRKISRGWTAISSSASNISEKSIGMLCSPKSMVCGDVLTSTLSASAVFFGAPAAASSMASAFPTSRVRASAGRRWEAADPVGACAVVSRANRVRPGSEGRSEGSALAASAQTRSVFQRSALLSVRSPVFLRRFLVWRSSSALPFFSKDTSSNFSTAISMPESA